MLDRPVLLLNSGFIPIDLINAREAILLILSDKANIVKENHSLFLRSVLVKIPLPEVISLWNYDKIPKKEAKFSRVNIFYRDDFTCAYCGKKYSIGKLTIDHIIPRSKWKGVGDSRKPKKFNSWKNVVTACMSCNISKGNQLLKESAFRLRFKPRTPKYLPQLFISNQMAKEFGWTEFLNYNAKIIDYVN